ncbi:MAG: protein translocase subunit SecF [Halobacteriaceae archaeon]
MVEFEVPEVDHGRYSNRQLVVVPVAVVILAVLVLVAGQFAFGTPVTLGIEFTGGTELTVTAPGGVDQVRSAFDREIVSVQGIRTEQNTYIVTFQSANEGGLAETAEAAGLAVDAIRTTSAAFGDRAQQQALYGILLAFFGMSVVVAVLFRAVVPSAAVVASAFGDIVVPLALMNLLGIKLTLGAVAALLMLIGYSVDSDILLTNHVLRRSGGFYDSVQRSMRTGVTMTVTSIAAMTVMTIVATAFGVELLASIGLILVFGLVTDLLNTYMLNVGLLRWYVLGGERQ